MNSDDYDIEEYWQEDPPPDDPGSDDPYVDAGLEDLGDGYYRDPSDGSIYDAVTGEWFNDDSQNPDDNSDSPEDPNANDNPPEDPGSNDNPPGDPSRGYDPNNPYLITTDNRGGIQVLDESDRNHVVYSSYIDQDTGQRVVEIDELGLSQPRDPTAGLDLLWEDYLRNQDTGAGNDSGGGGSGGGDTAQPPVDPATAPPPAAPPAPRPPYVDQDSNALDPLAMGPTIDTPGPFPTGSYSFDNDFGRSTLPTADEFAYYIRAPRAGDPPLAGDPRWTPNYVGTPDAVMHPLPPVKPDDLFHDPMMPPPKPPRVTPPAPVITPKPITQTPPVRQTPTPKPPVKKTPAPKPPGKAAAKSGGGVLLLAAIAGGVWLATRKARN